VPHTTTKGQASNAGGGDDSGWYRQPKGMHRVVHITPRATATHPNRACPGIDMNVLDGRKVDNQAVITYSQTAGIMAPAPNGNPQIVFPAEMNCGHHVGYICALGNQTRFSIDHGVIHSAFFFVFLVGGLYQVTPQLTLEFTNVLLLHIFLSYSVKSNIPGVFDRSALSCGKGPVASSLLSG
jgi:hypothetical protein